MASTVLQIIITPITELAKLLVVPLQHEVSYLVKFHSNIECLRSKTMELEISRETARCTTDAARRRGEATTRDMEQWLIRSEIILTDVQKLLGGLEGENMRNSKLCCTNLHSRYVSSKRAAKLLKVVSELKGSLQQIPVSQPAPPPSIEMMPTGDFEAFVSTKNAIEKIVDALKHDNNQIIGVYGMGGVGKTSLIKEVAKYAKITSMFDEVVIATVSRNPVMSKIQKEIAEGLGLQLVEESEHLRSLRLAERLKQGRILIILDDVWERLDLSRVGVSFGKDRSNCKIAITTRNLDVCSEMYCDVSIVVEPLSQQDSWDLFKKFAGDVVESPDLNRLANEVAKECGGLPIALVTLGRVLRNKELRFWNYAVYELRQSRPLNIKGMHEKVFSCLKLSFDEFHNEESQMCFLYCALFPEDYDVRVEDLLRYGIGDRLFAEDLTLEQARNRVHAIISNLKASCLLLSGKNEECVKMHDVFRDLAILISSGNDYSFMVKAGSGLKEWPCNINLQYVMRMSLINNEFNKFIEQGEYPELILLLLQNNTSLQSISDDLFAGMKALQVLDLSNIPSMVKLPTSLSFLTNLKTLCVENNKLKDGYTLGELKSIEILSLRKSSFDRFPEEIKRLTNLRLLDLSESQFQEFPANVLSSLVRLEELYMGGSYNGWEIQEATSKRKANLLEVLSMDHLNTLHIDIGNHACLVEEITNRHPRLKKFHIHVGDKLDSLSTYATSISLNISDHFEVPKPFMNWLKSFLQTTLQFSIMNWNNLSSLEELPLECFNLLKHLHIQKCQLQTCLSSELFERFQGLQELQIFSCLKLNSVFLSNSNIPESNVLLRLTKMHVRDAPSLTALWTGVAPSTGFQNLKHVKVEECKLVKILFPLAVAEMLNQLQYLEISNCDVMEAVIGNVGDHEVRVGVLSNQPNNTSTGVEYTHTIFPRLQVLKLQHLKSIRSLSQQWFIPVFPTLEHLTVLSCPSLKLPLRPEGLQRLIEVRAKRSWFEELEFENNEMKLSLQKCFTDTSSSTQ